MTSYLLSLAVFIPARGWMADRFGARTRVPRRHRRLRRSARSPAACPTRSTARRRPRRPGHGRRHDDAGRPPGHAAHDAEARARRRDGLADHPGAARPAHRARRSAASSPPISPGAGSSGSTFRSACSASCWPPATCRTCARRGAAASTSSASCCPAPASPRCCPARRSPASGSCPPARSLGLVAAGAILVALYVPHARRAPTPVLELRLLRIPTFRASVVGGSLFRIGIGAHAVPAAADAAARLRPHALQSGLVTFTAAVGALAMKTSPPIIRAFRLPPRAGRQCPDLRAPSLAACGLFTPPTPMA